MERATLPAARAFRPSRSKGQCFLRDARVIERVAELVAPRPGETLLEIGSGAGQLTLPLVERGARILAVESDARLASELERRLRSESVETVELIHQDALELDLRALLDQRELERVRVCGNLPYSVASPILLRLLAAAERFDELVLMFQDEVASRLTARPGTKEYGFLTVVAQQAAEVSVLFRIPPDAFRPRPRVHSALVRFELRHEEAPGIGDVRTFRAVVRALLAHRRKTIGNNVKRLRGAPLSRERVESALEGLGIDPGRRAETLSVEDFAELSRAIHA